MGYFSNGSEGEGYTDRWCDRCIHNDPEGPFCAVWMLHAEWNYSQYKDAAQKHALDALIPPDGIFNAQCKMFIEAKDVTP